MTFFPFRSVTLEGYRRNLTQMLTRLRRCAEAMFWMAGFKVMDWPYIQNPASHLVPVLKPGIQPLGRILPRFAVLLLDMR